jgi:hypothetical protein
MWVLTSHQVGLIAARRRIRRGDNLLKICDAFVKGSIGEAQLKMDGTDNGH